MPTKNKPQTLQCPTQEEIPREFRPELVQDLASLADASRGFAASSIALLGFGSRTLLEQRGMIELHGEFPQKIIVTDNGWRLIASCAAFVKDADDCDWRRCFDLEGETISA